MHTFHELFSHLQTLIALMLKIKNVKITSRHKCFMRSVNVKLPFGKCYNYSRVYTHIHMVIQNCPVIFQGLIQAIKKKSFYKHIQKWHIFCLVAILCYLRKNLHLKKGLGYLHEILYICLYEYSLINKKSWLFF